MFSLGITSNARHDVEITVISAEHLTINGRPIKSKAFVTVSTGGYLDSRSYSTRINEDGGHRPYWNDKFRVDLPWSLRGVLVEVRRRGSSGDRIVGMARIPASDFTGEYCVPIPNHLHFLSYRLRDTKGARNGIVNLSVRVMSPVAASSPFTFDGSKGTDKSGVSRRDPPWDGDRLPSAACLNGHKSRRIQIGV